MKSEFNMNNIWTTSIILNMDIYLLFDNPPNLTCLRKNGLLSPWSWQLTKNFAQAPYFRVRLLQKYRY